MVDDFCDLVDRKFADLRLTDSSGELEIACRIADAVAVRFELPGTEYLHLSSVLIEADGLDHPTGQTSRTTSSVWKNYDETLASGVIFDPGNTTKAFHTRKDNHPWLEIKFDQARDLHKITVRNVAGPNSVRARGLQVLVRTADGRLRTVYDGVARERELVRTAERFGNGDLATGAGSIVPAVKRILPVGRILPVKRNLPVSRSARRDGTSVALAPDLARMLCHVWLGDYQAVRFALDRSGIDSETAGRFQTAVNQKILYPRKLEWTSHGVRRSFRFWTRKQREEYVGLTLDVIEALRELTDDVCLGFGSVLSVVRDHALLPHDDDLDVLIGFEPGRAATHADGRKLVRECLVGHGFTVSGEMHSYQWVTRPGGGPRLDVFIGVFEDDRISWYPGRRGALTRSMMFPARQEEFLGRQVPVPHKPELYLEQIYGSGWVTPDPGFRHNWQPATYADIAG